MLRRAPGAHRRARAPPRRPRLVLEVGQGSPAALVGTQAQRRADEPAPAHAVPAPADRKAMVAAALEAIELEVDTVGWLGNTHDQPRKLPKIARSVGSWAKSPRWLRRSARRDGRARRVTSCAHRCCDGSRRP